MPTAIVTGASMGLGEALAHGLARGRLVAGHRRPGGGGAGPGGRRHPRAICAGSPVAAIGGDVTDPSHRARLVAAAAGLGDLSCSSTTPALSGRPPCRP